MKLSNTGMGTTKLNNIDEMYPGQSILLQTGQLVQYGAGLFAYNTIPLLVRRKVEQIIQETLNKYNCVEVLLPTLQPDTIWKNSGRYDAYVNDGTMLITESNKGTFCLAPTGEEAMLEFAREKLKSYTTPYVHTLPTGNYSLSIDAKNGDGEYEEAICFKKLFLTKEMSYSFSFNAERQRILNLSIQPKEKKTTAVNQGKGVPVLSSTEDG